MGGSQKPVCESSWLDTRAPSSSDTLHIGRKITSAERKLWPACPKLSEATCHIYLSHSFCGISMTLSQVLCKNTCPWWRGSTTRFPPVHVDKLIRSEISGVLVPLAVTVGTLPIPLQHPPFSGQPQYLQVQTPTSLCARSYSDQWSLLSLCTEQASMLGS